MSLWRKPAAEGWLEDDGLVLIGVNSDRVTKKPAWPYEASSCRGGHPRTRRQAVLRQHLGTPRA